MSNVKEHKYSTALSWAFWLNLLFSAIEMVGGVLTNSSAIIADAFHDLTDAITIGLAVCLERLSAKPKTSFFTYGYKRLSLISAMAMSLVLITGSVLMILEAIEGFSEPEEVNSVGMLLLAVLGCSINAFASWKIGSKAKSDPHSSGEPKGIGHSHGVGQKHLSNNSRAIMLHLLEDSLGWLAVLIGAIVIYFTRWYWIDSLLLLMIAAFIGFNATKNLLGTIRILLQAVPDDVSMEILDKEIKELEGVEDVHDLHVWSLDGNYNISSLHIVTRLDDTASVEALHAQIVRVMKENNINHTTIQIETPSSKCQPE